MNNINTKKYEKTIKKVFIDNRESKRIDYALDQYKPFNPSVVKLEIGDYIFKSHNNEFVVFEYKTASDFITSITGENHHLDNQVYHMITNYDYTFVIVEAEDLKEELQKRYWETGQDIGLSQINGSIAEYCINSTCLIVQTQYQAFDLMMRIAGKIFQHPPIRYKYGKKSENVALNFLTAIKGLDNKAQTIVSTLNLETLTDLMELTKDDLLRVDKIGDKTADMILSKIRR